MGLFSADRSPSAKLGLAILIGLLLAIPLFSVWMLVYDRQMPSETARPSLALGCGGPHPVAVPLLLFPFRHPLPPPFPNARLPLFLPRLFCPLFSLSPSLSLLVLLLPSSRLHL